MKIKATDVKKVQAALDKVQARATARTLTAEYVRDLAGEAEAHLNRHYIPVKYRPGCIVMYAERVSCHAYQKKSFKAAATSIRLTRGSSAWFMDMCQREEFFTGNETANFQCLITASAKEAAIIHLIDSLRVIGN